MRKNGIYAHFSAGRVVKMSRRSIIWKNNSEICKKLERMRKFKTKRQRKCAKTAFMLIFQQGRP
jgi:hypothetical protein